MREGGAAAAVRVPKRRARWMSFSPPARISEVEAEQPSISTASGPRKGSGRGNITNLMVRPRRYSVPNCRPDWSVNRSEEHTSELQSLRHLVCRLLLEKKKKNTQVSQRTRPPAVTFLSGTLQHLD